MSAFDPKGTFELGSSSPRKHRPVYRQLARFSKTLPWYVRGFARYKIKIKRFVFTDRPKPHLADTKLQLIDLRDRMAVAIPVNIGLASSISDDNAR